MKSAHNECTYPEGVFFVPHYNQTQLARIDFDVRDSSFNLNGSLAEWYSDTRGGNKIITVR